MQLAVIYLTVDSVNMRVILVQSVLPTSQLYVGGQIPSAATGSVGTGGLPGDIDRSG